MTPSYFRTLGGCALTVHPPFWCRPSPIISQAVYHVGNSFYFYERGILLNPSVRVGFDCYRNPSFGIED